MKRITVILALAALVALMASPVFAAPARLINYQGRLTDPAGNNVANGVYTIAFKIYDVATGGSALWSETLPIQVTDGLFTVQLGADTPIPSDLFSGGNERHLGVTVNLDPEIAPRTLLNWVAHAYFAEIAGDLACAGCVAATDIATDAVGSAEIATNAVNADEIAASAVGTSEVADGSLTAVDIDDEPGVANNTNSGTITMDGTVQTLLSRIITAPAAGYVLAIATAEVNMAHTNGTTSNAKFGVSSTAGAFPANQDVDVRTSSTAPTGTYYHAVTVHGLFSAAGGADAFYFLGDETGGNFSVSDLQLTLIYFPTAHGTVVSTAAASGGEITSSDSVPESGGGLVQAQVVENPRQGTAPASFQQELALVKADMEARIQKLEEQLKQNQPGTEEKR